MADLAEVLAPVPGVRLLQGVVQGIAGGGKYIHITWGTGVIQNAGKLDGTTYAVDDLVWFLQSDEAGALVIGKQAAGTHDDAMPTPPAALTFTPSSSNTYDQITGTWIGGRTQSPDTWACWFWTAGVFSPLAGYPLASAEIEITLSSGGPIEFVAHLNVAGSGVLVTTGDRYLYESTPVGVATWVPLPLDWGHQMATGEIKGIAIGGGFYSGTYTGLTRLRLTPIN